MPARQRGTTVKRGPGSWQARYTDEDGKQRGRGGFASKTAARDWLDDKLREVEKLRRGEMLPASDRPETVDELLDVFLAKHGRRIDPATVRKLEAQLRKARDEFGSRHPDSLRKSELEDWQLDLPDGSRHDCFRALRQALAWASDPDRGYCERNASATIKNPKRSKSERKPVHPFETWAEVFAVADELDGRYRALPILLVGTGLRPEEAFGLHRSHLDRERGMLLVEQRYSGGMVKPGTKNGEPERYVPLRRIVLDALAAMPPRIDTPILFPAPRGGYIDIERFRHREWTPALRAAGIEHRRIYDCRHTFATWAIADGMRPAWIAEKMGTSLAQLDDTYARWLKRSDDRLRDEFDQADVRRLAAERDLAADG